MPAPILAVTDPRSPAQSYIIELLHTVGLPCVESCGSGELPGHDPSPDTVLLLCDPNLGTSASEAVVDFIRAGGRAVALQPPPSLVDAFGSGLSPSGSGNGFVRVNPGPAGFGGLPDDPVQYFGIASYLTAPDEQAGADLLEDDRYSYGARAVVVGNGGRTVAFAYDLIGTVLTLRFGLAWGAGSAAWIKPPVFYRHVVDPRRRDVPQADVHLALLARALDLVSERTLPRVWPLPHGAPTALVLTCDGDENDPALFMPILETVRAHGAKITFYLMPHTKIDPRLADEIRAEGHSIAPHPHIVVDGRGPHGEYARAYAHQLDEFLGGTAFPGAATLGVGPHRGRPITVRAHGLQSVCEPGAAGWTGYNAQAAIYADAGFRMELNCYSVPPYQAGYMNGSALPMQFLDAGGRFLPCYQQATQFADDILVGDGAHSVQVDGETTGEWLVRALAASADRYHGAIVVNVHPHRFARSRPMLERALRFCAETAIPVLDAESWCAFTLAARRVELDVSHPALDGRTVRARATGGRGDIAIALGDRYRPQGHTALSERPVHGRPTRLATYDLGPEWTRIATEGG